LFEVGYLKIKTLLTKYRALLLCTAVVSAFLVYVTVYGLFPGETEDQVIATYDSPNGTARFILWSRLTGPPTSWEYFALVESTDKPESLSRHDEDIVFRYRSTHDIPEVSWTSNDSVTVRHKAKSHHILEKAEFSSMVAGRVVSIDYQED